MDVPENARRPLDERASVAAGGREQVPAEPAHLSLDPEGVPHELRAIPQWVAWRLAAPKESGKKPRKIPIAPFTATNASSTDAKTWGTFSEACACALAHRLAGVGFVLNASGIAGLDLDKCRDAVTGAIEPWAQEIVQRFHSYSEVSPSGTGLRIVVRGTLPRGRRRKGPIEVYDNERFLTITGHRLADAPEEIAARQEELDDLVTEISGKAKAMPKLAARELPQSATASDDQVLERARRGRNRVKFNELYSGGLAGYNSTSEADAALLHMLAFWTGGDATRMDRMFRTSGRMRDKWDEKRADSTWGAQEIQRAIARVGTQSTHLRIVQDESMSGSGSPKRPQVEIIPGTLPRQVDLAEEVLLGMHPPRLFQRDRMLVRIVRTATAMHKPERKRPANASVLHPIEAHFLVDLWTRHATWLRERDGVLVQVDAPPKVANTYLARVGEWRLPRLIGVIEAPTIRPDGSVLQVPGYDARTQRFFDPGNTVFPQISATPSMDDARAALNVLYELIRDFPWVAPCDRSAMVAAILTALVRRVLPTAPLFAFRAPKMSSGKSLLVDVVALIATGRVVAVMTQGKDDEEQQKRMLAVLIEGDAVNSIDNIERPLGGADLCVILTQQSYQGRLLGSTKMVRVPTCTMWVATGNNLEIKGDLASRVVLCDLDPMQEHPEEREFDVDLRAYIPEHRGELVHAALTIILAFIHAGRPKQKIRQFGRFEAWSEMVRGPLVWLGEPDPLDTARRLGDVDPVQRMLGDLLIAWHARFGEAPQLVRGVLDSAIAAPYEPLGDAIANALASPLDVKCTQQLGLYLRKYERRVQDGLRFERVGDRGGRAQWRVVRIVGGVTGVTGVSQPEPENSGPGPSREGEGVSVEEEGRMNIPLGETLRQLPQLHLDDVTGSDSDGRGWTFDPDAVESARELFDTRDVTEH